MRKIQISWTVIDLWNTKQYDKAILTLNRIETEPTVYMIDGNRIHNEISDKRLKLFDFMKNGVYEVYNEDPKKRINYFVVPVNDFVNFSFQIDYLSIKDKYFIDWKTGAGKKMQGYCYAYALKQKEIDIKKFYIANVFKENNVIQTSGYKLYKINQDKIAEAEDVITGTASEIYSYINS